MIIETVNSTDIQKNPAAVFRKIKKQPVRLKIKQDSGILMSIKDYEELTKNQKESM